MLNSIAERMKLIRKSMGISRREFQEKFLISLNTLQSWEDERTKITDRSINRYITALEHAKVLCSKDWLVNGVGDPPKYSNESLLFLPGMQISNYNNEGNIIREIEKFESLNQESIVIRIADNLMSPIYKMGDYIGGVKHDLDKIDSLLGEPVIIKTQDNLTLCRIILKSTKQGLFRLLHCGVLLQISPNIFFVKSA